MAIRSNEKYDKPIKGVFEIGHDRQIAGSIEVKKNHAVDSAIVSLVDNEFLHLNYGDSLYGVTEAGRASLHDCAQAVSSHTQWHDFGLYHGDAPFRCVLFGEEFIKPEERCIHGIEFSLVGSDASVFTGDLSSKHGSIFNPSKATLDALKNELNAPDNDFSASGSVVTYYKGDSRVLSEFKTSCGTIHIWRPWSMSGHNMHNDYEPRINIRFDNELLTVDDSVSRMFEIRQFFTWIMGYAPIWEDLAVYTSREFDAENRTSMGNFYDLFIPQESKEDNGLKNRRFQGALIDGIGHSEHFIDVMNNWLKRNINYKRRQANVRLFGSFDGTSRKVLEDRIVAAANMFDLLPDEDKPASSELPQKVQSTIDCAMQEIRKEMDQGSQRDDLLTSLGHLKSSTTRLRATISHRADIVIQLIGEDRLPNINADIRLAVNCRNYYTHGRASSEVDFGDPTTVWYLAVTLEFIYMVSELTLCGWDPSKSIKGGFHPYEAYLREHDSWRNQTEIPK